MHETRVGGARTTVVHCRYHKCDVYIGRPSIFGNPFKIDANCSREKVIEMYRQYFHGRVIKDSQFRVRVMSLKGKVLGCHCKPLACHGDVIVEYLEGTGG